MMKDIAIFDTMYEQNLQYFKELSLYIIAGEKKLEELHQKLKEGEKEPNKQIISGSFFNAINKIVGGEK